MSTQSPTQPAAAPQGLRKNGKQWHTPRTAFRLPTPSSSWAQRLAARTAQAATKAKVMEMKAEKEETRQVGTTFCNLDSMADFLPQKLIEQRRSKSAAKAEKERFELLAGKMHHRRVERLKRKEKRNKLLKS
ncbi:MAG: hypothetical protein M1829_003720 [Trizodia sp. TS-e1964]|nr:MAG: hypothetical protein M1829_003720 [Trizodia sp. TS-e1964]